MPEIDKTAAELYSVRDTLRRLYGAEEYERRIRPTTERLQEAAAEAGVGVLEFTTGAAQLAIDDGNPWAAFRLLAAAVEAVEGTWSSPAEVA